MITIYLKAKGKDFATAVERKESIQPK